MKPAVSILPHAFLHKIHALLLLALIGTSPLVQAAPAPWTFDPDHARIAFFVMHDDYAHAIGTFSQIQGTLWFDPDDWSTARVEATINLDTLDLGSASLNARIAKRDYLDSKNHPQARFVSSTVTSLTAQTARVEGQLELRGTQVPVTLEVTLNKAARSAWSLRRTVGFSATATLHRSALGMNAHRNAVGDEVTVRIEVEAVRARRSQTATQETD